MGPPTKLQLRHLGIISYYTFRARMTDVVLREIGQTLLAVENVPQDARYGTALGSIDIHAAAG